VPSQQTPERRLLDPKLDVVFKMLFADERNKHVLLRFTNAVLKPPTPFVDVEVLNPEIPKETVATKGAILDVLARMADGSQVNIEMQADSHEGFWQRGLYYWAGAYTAQLERGAEYHELRRTESIFVLNFRGLETERFYSIFHLLEVHEHTRLTDDLAIHVIELPKLPAVAPDPESAEVLKWAKFFAAKTDEELDELAMNDPELKEANEALGRLSADPASRRLARERELALWNYERTLRLEREAGEATGEANVLLRLITRKFGPVSAPVRQRVLSASRAELERWTDQILTAKSFDEMMGE
jgi:predicted transposase/invertase (TIGR01784 family)